MSDTLDRIQELAIAALADEGPEALTGAKTEALMQIRDLAHEGRAEVVAAC